ncbi:MULTISPECIES: hypothetical protein [unclassified Cupriavidus]|uniref:hypothetical protein n=1 Tax=unclassified Cupriavidus TaxID=2640874 RepID=UPI001C0040BF|nr:MULTISPECIES: hypothetical protein [unclassified Cupriavidus]MCA3187907.1 hypothetical protein [Cupriavidus sp.]MCA3189454.1 hypothetical protein [Cupriavidus sp.]MCA3195534.1 hypothetical protein [Cupriavidus sp.]MCA3201089.1 hypothetical protein [Cupriavidus sp.]MCA3207897.1 hypothetical protein [Cupriavidus sp.]
MDDDEFERRIRATAIAIREWCGRNDVAIAGDDSVCESAASRILGYRSGDALRKQAAQGRNQIPFRLRGNVRFYRVVDLSRTIETSWNGE